MSEFTRVPRYSLRTLSHPSRSELPKTRDFYQRCGLIVRIGEKRILTEAMTRIRAKYQKKKDEAVRVAPLISSVCRIGWVARSLTRRPTAAGGEEEPQRREAEEASGGQQTQDDWLNSVCGT